MEEARAALEGGRSSPAGLLLAKAVFCGFGATRRRAVGSGATNLGRTIKPSTNTIIELLD
jgi:hypothetical protein